jgi:hypothetical protein
MTTCAITTHWKQHPPMGFVHFQMLGLAVVSLGATL